MTEQKQAVNNLSHLSDLEVFSHLTPSLPGCKISGLKNACARANSIFFGSISNLISILCVLAFIY